MELELTAWLFGVIYAAVYPHKEHHSYALDEQLIIYSLILSFFSHFL